MSWLRSEPAMVIISGGTVLVQAVMQLLLAFDVPITQAQQAAVTTFVGVILGFLTRANVTPTAALPPGVAGDIADAKAARQADRI
jgi:Asp/Glu/hydantoin racemase